MKNMFGLKEKHIEAINGVFANHLNVERVIIYGSRAKGNFRDGSDIDLCLKGTELSVSELFKIETALDDLLLPYCIDLSIYHVIDNEQLLEHIDRIGLEFYKKS